MNKVLKLEGSVSWDYMRLKECRWIFMCHPVYLGQSHFHHSYFIQNEKETKLNYLGHRLWNLKMTWLIYLQAKSNFLDSEEEADSKVAVTRRIGSYLISIQLGFCLENRVGPNPYDPESFLWMTNTAQGRVWTKNLAKILENQVIILNIDDFRLVCLGKSR